MINCLSCDGNNIIKKRKRTTKLGVEQIYYCKDCNKTFVQKRFKNKTYDARVIVEAINLYNLGNTLEGSARLINRRYKIHVTKIMHYAKSKEKGTVSDDEIINLLNLDSIERFVYQ